MSFDIGHRVAVVEGSLEGYYGHVGDDTGPWSPDYVAVILRGSREGVPQHPNPNVSPGKEWFIPARYLEHID